MPYRIPLLKRRRSFHTRLKVLRFLWQYERVTGFYPSIHEIMAGTGITSTSVVTYHLEALHRMGAVVRSLARKRKHYYRVRRFRPMRLGRLE